MRKKSQFTFHFINCVHKSINLHKYPHLWSSMRMTTSNILANLDIKKFAIL